MTTTRTAIEPQPLTLDTLEHITDMETGGDRNYFSAYTPNLTLLAIARAGAYLRNNPNKPLAEAPVFLESDKQDDFSSQVIASMINASIERPEQNPDGLAFNCVDPFGVNICKSAEPRFIDAVDATKDLDVVTDNDKPVLAIKYLGEVSCLTLRDVTIDGIPYPAGSITRPVIKETAVNREINSERKTGPGQYTIDEVKSLGFMRLSMFALPLADRPLWRNAYSAPDFSKIRKVTIDDIAARVQQSMDIR